MRKLTLTRGYTNSADDMPIGTTGVLQGVDLELHTLELPWRNNEPNISCIPAGVYALLYHPRGYIIIGGTCAVSENDIGTQAKRFGCLFHVANYPWEIKGCIAPGTGHGVAEWTDDPKRKACTVWHSRDALEKMRVHIGTTPAQLTIEWR